MNPRTAYDFARQYSIETETFDRGVCTGPVIRGEIQPANYRQVYAVSANAIKVRKRLIEEAAAVGVRWLDVRQALRHYEDSARYLEDMAAL